MLPVVRARDELVLEYSERNDRDFSSEEKEPVWWKCHICGHEWKEKVERRFRGSGCPLCNMNKIRHLKIR